MKEEKFQRPVKMVAIWTPTTLSTPGKPVTRGLGGRIYFYNDIGDTIPVEGQLMVYAYDDSARKRNVSHVNSTGGVDEPDRKYAFTPEQFTAHFSATDLGASYSVWIPWGPVDGPPVKVSLVPVFTASGGNVVMAQASRNVLKGTTSGIPPGESDAEAFTEEDGVVRTEQRTRQTELRTTTIPISDTTAERMMRAGEMPIPQPAMSRPAMSQPPPPQANPAAVVPASYNQEAVQQQATQQRPAIGAGRGVPPPWMPPQPPPTRFEPRKFPVPAGPSPQPASDRAPTPQSPSALPSGPPSSPEPSYPYPAQAASSGESQTAGPGW